MTAPAAPPVLVAEDVLLLLTDDESGKAETDAGTLDRVLAGALLVEGVLDGRLAVTQSDGAVRRGRVVAAPDAAPTGDALTDRVLATVAEKPRTPADVVGELTKDVREAVLARLIERGWLREQRTRALGLTWGTRHPTVDPSHEDALRAELAAVLLEGREPSPRTAAVVALLSAAGQVKHAVDALDRATRKAAEQRATDVAEGSWVAAGVKKSLDDLLGVYLVGAVVGSTVIMNSS